MVIVLTLLKSNQPDTNVNTVLPYKKKDYILTKAERSFYEVLKLSSRSLGVELFTKVRLADLFYIPSNTSNRIAYLNKITSKHVDFVLCDTVNLRPLLAIELDDSSHNQQSRVKRDEFVEKVFKNAGLPLLRIPARNSYNLQEVSTMLKNYTQAKSEIAVTKSE